MTTPHVLIVGTGAAGAAAARRLATEREVRVTLVGDTEVTPYTRMLIKGIAFGSTPPELIALPLPEVDRLADSVTRIDPVDREAHLASGARLGYDALVIATGSRPRLLPDTLPGAQTAMEHGRVSPLHSLPDALRIRARLAWLGRPARVAIYGGGIIAAETASTLHDAGHTVLLIARSTVPGAAAFGAPVAERLVAAHQSRVHTYFGHTVSRVDAADPGVVVTLDDDRPLIADLLLLALGTLPAAPAPWAGGVDVDEHLRTGLPRHYAAGGVALHHDEALGAWRIDHWEDAVAQGTHAARVALHDLDLGDDPGPYLPRSPFLALVYGHAITGVGATVGATSLLETGDEFVVRHERGDSVIGVTGIDAVGTVAQWGPRLHAGTVTCDIAQAPLLGGGGG
ncbi:FAD-dependent oxidoreductase [Leucobacter sp. wl10]|uniref:FAD-dependent oxidoreductase n=1 Tax=Leucobacter sp. wl10 TaxID=2304677 RepID=UPI000E5A2004|nr:NAD(P)/FAD-dependent oxidoreductase [Leucobacter sp. wl10]RGE19055.1 ferredoxin reductase [Leucobacter sp. wl10]